MCYKSNYEPYTSQSLDVKRAEDLSSEELLNPLGSLYPHVVALQLQSDDTPWIRAKNYAGYQDRNNNSWVDVYSTEDYARPSARRRSDYHSTAYRFVSRIRRFLTRDEMRRLRRQRAA